MMSYRALILAVVIGFSTYAVARSVYVNGQDVSSARNQLMENVTVRIDQEGHVFIEAPHYQVNEESTYIPLRPSVRETPLAHRPRGESPFTPPAVAPAPSPLASAAALPEQPANAPAPRRALPSSLPID